MILNVIKNTSITIKINFCPSFRFGMSIYGKVELRNQIEIILKNVLFEHIHENTVGSITILIGISSDLRPLTRNLCSIITLNDTDHLFLILYMYYSITILFPCLLNINSVHSFSLPLLLTIHCPFLDSGQIVFALSYFIWFWRTIFVSGFGIGQFVGLKISTCFGVL